MLPVIAEKHGIGAGSARVCLSDVESFTWHCSKLAKSRKFSRVCLSNCEQHYSALTIQSFLRGRKARLAVWGKDGVQAHSAAAKIQSWSRGVQCRQVLQGYRRAVEARAAIRIQAQVRGKAAKEAKLLAKANCHALKIQRFLRALWLKAKDRSAQEEKVAQAATCIQMHVRKHCVQKQLPVLQAGMLEAKESLKVSARELQRRLEEIDSISDSHICDCMDLQTKILSLGMLVHITQGKPVEAMSTYTRVLRCNCDSVPALYMRVIAGIDACAPREEGYRDLRRAADLSKANPMHGLSLVKRFYWYFKARIGYYDEHRMSMFLAIARGLISGDHERAEVLWDRAITLAPDRLELLSIYRSYKGFWIQREKLVSDRIRSKVGYVRIQQKGDSFIFALLDFSKQQEDTTTLPLIVAQSELNQVLKDPQVESVSSSVVAGSPGPSTSSHTALIRFARRLKKIAEHGHKWKLIVPSLSKYRDNQKLRLQSDKMLVSVQSGVRGLIARRQAARERARLQTLSSQQNVVWELRALQQTKRQQKAACATIIQSRARGILGRVRQVLRRSAAITIQSHLRGYLARQMTMFLRQERTLGGNVRRIFVGTRLIETKFVIIECLKAGSTYLLRAVDTEANKCCQGIITKRQMQCIAYKKNIMDVPGGGHLQLSALLDDLVFRKVNKDEALKFSLHLLVHTYKSFTPFEQLMTYENSPLKHRLNNPKQILG